MTGRLRRLARRGAPPEVSISGLHDQAEQCELCASPIPPSHPHLLERSSGLLRCACRACAVVLNRPAGVRARYGLVPDRYLELPELARDDARWADLGIPVSLAFLVRSDRGEGRAVFPGALGPTDAVLRAEAWSALEAAYPAVRQMESDVEAVLVNRVRGARECWIVPIDACYRLVALVRSRWEGINGGNEVWVEIERFFDALPRSSGARNDTERRRYPNDQQEGQSQSGTGRDYDHQAGAHAGGQRG